MRLEKIYNGDTWLCFTKKTTTNSLYAPGDALIEGKKYFPFT